MSRGALALWAIALLSVSSCAVATTPALVPASLRTVVDRYAVTVGPTWTHRVTFGPYAARHVGGYHSRFSADATRFNEQVDRDVKQYRGSFDFVAEGESFHAECRQERRKAVRHRRGEFYFGFSDGRFYAGFRDDRRVLEATYLYHCDLTRADGGALALYYDRYGGIAHVDGRELLLGPINSDPAHPQTFWGLSTGLLFVDEEQPLAAVDLRERRMSVTLLRNLTKRRKAELAALCMAMLMLRDTF